MKVPICGSLETRARKSKARLLYPSSAEQTVRQPPFAHSFGSSLPTRLQKAHHHAAYCAQKRNTPRCSLAIRPLVLVLMSLCFSFLLTLIIQSVVNSPAMAAPPGPGAGFFQYTDGLCSGFSNKDILQVWVDDGVCDFSPVPNPEQKFVQPPGNGPCAANWVETTTQPPQQPPQEKCVLTVPAAKGVCPIGFALDRASCKYIPQNSVEWHVGFCKSFASDEVPPKWMQDGVCDLNPVDPNSPKLVQTGGNGSCPQDFIPATSRTGQQECVLEVPSFKSQCPIGFALNGGECDYQPPDNGIWQVGYCKSFSSNEVPAEWISDGVCTTNPVPGPFVQNPVSGSCPSNWVNTMLLSGQQQCVLTLPSFKGNSCPIGFVLHDSRCEYVPQNSGGWQVGFCKSFSSNEIPPEWIANRVCDIPSPDPETTFLKPGPCQQQNWIATTAESTQIQCLLTIPDVRGLCPIGFALNNGRCDYVPQGWMNWQAGFCRSFSSDEIPPEWVTNHVCDIPSPDPEQTFIKLGPCQQGWIRTTVEGGAVPKCALQIPTVRQLCPIGFTLDGVSCTYVPQNITGWQFPCSNRPDGTPNEQAVASDWLSGDSPATPQITSDPAVLDGTTGGRFEHTFATDTYGLKSVQVIFSPMLGLAFVLVTPTLILIGYQMMLAASSFRHAGALEGLSHVIFGSLVVAISFQIVTMLITFANMVSGAIVGLHSYLSTQAYGVSTEYTLAGVNEPLTSYRGMVMPVSRWGCAVNDFVGILGNQFFSHQITVWLPVIGHLAPLAMQVTTGAELASRLTEFARMVLSVMLWLQAVIRIGLLNCYILTCPLAFACWALPGGLGQRVVQQWVRGFLLVLFIQVVQIFLITVLPLILPSFPAVAGDNQGIMQILFTQLPPLLALWLTVSVPKWVGISATRAIGMTGVMAGGIISTVGAAASLLG